MMVKGSPASSPESVVPPDSVNKGPAAQDQAARYSQACPALTTIFSPILRPLWAPGGDNWGGVLRTTRARESGRWGWGRGFGLVVSARIRRSAPAAGFAPLSKTVVL